MQFFSLTRYGIDRAIFLAEKTAHALLGFDIVDDKLFTDQCGAALLLDMNLVLLKKIFQSGKDGIRSRLSKCTQRARGDSFG